MPLLLLSALGAPFARVAAQDAAVSLPPATAAVFAGYAAKVTASALFVSGRPLASVRAEELAPDSPMTAAMHPFLRLLVDRPAGSVTATVGDSSAVATFVPGIGCTLATGDRLRALRAAAPGPTPAAPPDPRPWPLGDGPPEALPPPDGVDTAALQAALDYGFAQPEDRHPVCTRAIVVVHRGRLVAERYAPGYDCGTALPGWSMTKGFVDALLGIRVADGALDPAAELPVPEWQAAADDPRRHLRLDDLLRMQSGLLWTEDYADAESHVLRMLFRSHDHGAVAAAEPLAVEPRTRFLYSGGTSNLLCRILRSTFADDKEHLAFARKRLFGPLGMRSALIECDPSGTPVGSSYGFATARDWARFGLFYLRDGVWDGQRILPEGWVAAARTPTATAPRGNYGRHVWLNAGAPDDPARRPFSRLPRDVFYLSGYEGQYTVCFPGADLVVVRLGCTKQGGFDAHGMLERVLRACGG